MKPQFVSKYPNLLKPDIPLVFTDGTDVYKNLADKYIRHKKGFFILAPSGVGKTHFISNQTDQHWLDGDDLWAAAHAHPYGEWWRKPVEVIDEIDQRCDVITVEAKKLGFWIIGASNSWLKPEGVVIPDWETHLGYIKKRESSNYDGGLTSDQVDRIKSSRQWMSRWEKENVKIYKSVEEAVNELTQDYKEE